MMDDHTTTVNKDYLKTIEKKMEGLKALIEVSAIISSTLDFNELMTLVMEKAKSFINAEACSILLYNKETNKLEFYLAISREESVSDILKNKVTLEMGPGHCRLGGRASNPFNDKGCKERQSILFRG